jgi:hypothetical protein
MMRQVPDKPVTSPLPDWRWLLGRIMLLMLAVLSALGGVHAQDIPPAEPTPTITPTPEPSPTPTLTPTPTPTATPTPTPTSTPSPSPEPTMTPTPAPTVTPDPTVAATPTMAPPAPANTPDATPTPSPTATVTPTATTAPVMARTVLARAGCDANGSTTVGFVQGYQSFAVFDCTPVRSTGRVTISVSAPATGWRYRVIESRTSPNTWRSAAYNESVENLGVFQIYLGPTDARVRGCGEVTVTVTAPSGNVIQSTLTATTPGVDASSCQLVSGKPVTASIVGGVLPPLQFSFEDRVASGNLSIRVENPSLSTGWSLDISGTDFMPAGGVPGQSGMPASSLRILRPGLPALPLSTTMQRVVSQGGGEPVYTYPMELVIPGGTVVGRYSATITIATTSAPGT